MKSMPGWPRERPFLLGLSSNGDGTLKAYTNQALSSAEAETIYPEAVIGIALEALDLSTSADVATRFKIMIV